MFIDKIEIHSKLCDEIHDTYCKKNHDYGDSFSQLYARFGLPSTVIRLHDKLSRLESLSQREAAVKDESIRDTLLDLANYAIMTIVEMDAKNSVEDPGVDLSKLSNRGLDIWEKFKRTNQYNKMMENGFTFVEAESMDSNTIYVRCIDRYSSTKVQGATVSIRHKDGYSSIMYDTHPIDSWFADDIDNAKEECSSCQS